MNQMFRRQAVVALLVALVGSSAWGQSLTWSGGSATWTEPDSVNWSGATYNIGSNVQFVGSGGTITVTNTGVAPGNILVDSSSGYTVQGGSIGGSGTLTKSGSGTLSLRDDNTFTGKTLVSGGIISVDDLALEGQAGPLGAPTGTDATIDMHPGTVFDFTPPDIRSVYFTTDRPINLAGTGSGTTVEVHCNGNDKWSSFGAVTGTGTGPRTLKLCPSGDRNRLRLTGPIEDTSDDKVSLEVSFNAQAAGAARVELEGTNTFSGPITITGNAKINPYLMFISAGGQLGSGNYTNTISIGNNVIFDYSSSATQELSGAISGVGQLNMSGSGDLTLSASNTYSGGTTISAGTLHANATNALGAGNVTVSGGMLVLDSSGAIQSGATLALPSETATNLTVNADNTVGSLYINGIRQPNGNYTAAGTGSGWMAGSGTLIVGAASLYWDRNGIAAGAGPAPNGIWDTATSSNWNTEADGTTGITTWGSGLTAAFSAGSDASGDYTVTVSGTSDINGINFEEGNATITNGALRLVAPGSIYVAAGPTATVATAISEDGSSRALYKSGSGTLVLSGTNTFTGPTEVFAGTLRAGVDTDPGVSGALGVDSAVTMADDATAVLDIDVYDVIIASLSGGGTSGGNVALGSGTLTLGVDGLSTSYSGSLTGAGNLVKAGSGTFTLSGNNAYTGDTSIAAGILKVGNNDTGNLGGGNYPGDISIAAGSQLIVARNVDQTFSGVISGEGSIEKWYGNTLTLSGSNTYSGSTGIIPQSTTGGGLSVSSLNSVNGGTPLLSSSSLGCPTTVVDGTVTLGSSGKRASCTLTYTGPGETTDRVIHMNFNSYSLQAIDASGTGLLKFTSPITSNNGGDTGRVGPRLTGTGEGELAGGMESMSLKIFEKSGSGTWTISGPCGVFYSTEINDGTLIANATNAVGICDVSVGGGTLVLAMSHCIPDTNRLTITSGTVQLDSGVKEIIGSLYFGAAAQTNGIWGSFASSAENKSANFTGTGKLYVGVPIPPSGMVLIVR